MTTFFKFKYMSLEDFQLLDNEPFDKFIIKRDFLKIYHQQGAQLNQSDQHIEFNFGENQIYHQIGNSYTEFDITVRREDNAFFTDNSPIRLTNNAFAYCFKGSSLRCNFWQWSGTQQVCWSNIYYNESFN